MRHLVAALILPALAGPVLAEGQGLPPGLFLLDRLNGEVFKAEATLEVGADGRTTGTAPCNRWSARGAGEAGLVFGPILSTRRACDDLPAELAFFAAMAEVTGVQWDAATGVLMLTGAEGQALVFQRQKE